MPRETGVPFKDAFVWFAKNRLRSFVRSTIYPACVSMWFILLLSNSFTSCEKILGQTFRIEDSLDGKNCKMEHVHLSFSTTSELGCLYRCSRQLGSDGTFYNYDKVTCTCCSESYTIPDGMPTGNGTRYYMYIKTYKEGRRGCGDLGNKGFTRSGIYEIFPNGQDGLSVFCDFDDSDGPWTVIQRRIGDTVDFNRNYTAYQEGFGNLSGSFWLGLDAMSTITLQSDKTYSLKINLVVVDDGEMYATYKHFLVMKESDDYTLNIRDYSGNAGDSLWYYHNGAPFSTYDREMDTWADGNCAEVLKGGWWFKGCHMSNLNGLYGVSEGRYGISWKPYENVITFAEMKVRENK